MRKYDIISSKPIGAEDESYLDYFLGETPEEAEDVYLRFSDLLNRVSGTYAKYSGLDREDLFGEALTGLARAVRDYDPDRSDDFKTYATYRIKSVLNKYIRENSCVVKAPAYIRSAHSYINSIKAICMCYGLGPSDVDDVLMSGDLTELELNKMDEDSIVEYIDKLRKLAKNSSISYGELIIRSEYVPYAVSYEEGFTQAEIMSREASILSAALLINDLKEYMDDIEVSICEGIMQGRTYEEIAYDLGFSAASTIRSRLDRLRDRFIRMGVLE